jgi:hypothetical protein
MLASSFVALVALVICAAVLVDNPRGSIGLGVCARGNGAPMMLGRSLLCVLFRVSIVLGIQGSEYG